MRRWTRLVIANRKKVIAAWLVLLAIGATASAGLGDLLTNRFSVPGSEAERGRDLLKRAMNERTDGNFTLVFRTRATSARSPSFKRAAEAAAVRGATAVRGAKAGPVLPAARNVAYVQITTPLEAVEASGKTPAIRKSIGRVSGASTYLSGFPAIDHDTTPLYNEDTERGEMIAIPIALVVMAFMFGTLGSIAVPFVFALITIPTTLGIVWIFAHYMTMAIYVQNIVILIGIAIAIDYSMLVLFRFREELERDQDHLAALETTMATAGRATFFSGMTVALGLALLVLMPVPFMRSMGVGGLLVPLVSIAAAATLLPAMLALLGRKVNSLRLIPRRVIESRSQLRPGMWTKLARSIMRRPVPYALGASALLIMLILPAFTMKVTGGDNRGLPGGTEATRGLFVLERALGPGALVPNQAVVDTGRHDGTWSPASIAAQRRLIARLRRDPEIDDATIQAPALLSPRGKPGARALRAARQANLVDRQGRVFQVRAAGRSDSGTAAAQDLVHRIRDRYIPEARFAPSWHVYLTGAPPFGVDFLDKSYGAFPWLVLAVLGFSYLLLMRAFRSIVLPAKAVLMNLLSVGATFGLLVLAFQSGWGDFIFKTSPQIEGWIPIFLFAMLFGLSMDYEVFLLSRMREEWDATHDNEEAVARGLERTGRIITAAAIIMIAAFSGFTAGRFVGLQQFGLGLSAAILLDATVVRAVLVPALMKLIGDWNWYMPERLRRLRVMGRVGQHKAHRPPLTEGTD